MRLIGFLQTVCLGAGLSAGLGAGAALAVDYKCAPVKLVVPYSAAGATDVASRIVAQKLEAAIKQDVIVENRPGATGNTGTVRDQCAARRLHACWSMPQ